MGKHKRYSEVKHPDKFAEALSNLWDKSERYIVRVGIVMAAALVVAMAWLIVSRFYAGRSERPWEERFKLSEEAASRSPEDFEGAGEALLAKMADFTRDYQGTAAAAVTLLELAQGHLRLAESRRAADPKAAREHFEEAAHAAEQFVADFPEHRHVALAHYEAGKARLELGERERAAQHFEAAALSRVPVLAALARWHAGYCYEQLGRLEQARQNYEAVRADPMAGWCAEQADFALAQLGRPRAAGAQREPGSPAPSPPNPAPPK